MAPDGGVPDDVDPERMARVWYAWKSVHPREAEDPATVWAKAYQLGTWHGIHLNGTLGAQELLEGVEALRGRCEELVALYRDVAIDIELTSGSAYWRSPRP